MTKEEMIRDFLRLYVVESDHMGAEVALTLIVVQQIKAEVTQCAGLTVRQEASEQGGVR